MQMKQIGDCAYVCYTYTRSVAFVSLVFSAIKHVCLEGIRMDGTRNSEAVQLLSNFNVSFL